MADLTLNVKSEMQGLNTLIRNFPELRARIFAYMGSRGRMLLKSRLLAGQEINLRAYPRDRTGRYTISHGVIKNASGVRWSSYPVNLFDRGRMLRSGRKEAGHQIIGKFRVLVETNLQRWAGAAERAILDKEFDKA